MKRIIHIIAVALVVVILGTVAALHCVHCHKPQQINNTQQEQHSYNEPADTTEDTTEPTASQAQEESNIDYEPGCTVKDPAEEVTLEDFEIVYKDSNIKVTYVGYKVKAYGPVIYFNIENLSDKTLTVLCTSVYIDGCRVYTSGLTCEKLAPDTTTVEEFVLLPKDNADEYNADKISFIIKLVNAKSYLDLYETDYITLDI